MKKKTTLGAAGLGAFFAAALLLITVAGPLFSLPALFSGGIGTSCSTAAQAASVSPEGWTGPGEGTVSSVRGYRVLPAVYGDSIPRMHHGVDIANPVGTPIYAAHDGVVTFAGMVASTGTVTVYHGGGISTQYVHMYADGIFVKAGDKVSAGQKIAETGMTGGITGPHLHFDVWQADGGGECQGGFCYNEEQRAGTGRNGDSLDPVAFLAERGVTAGQLGANADAVTASAIISTSTIDTCEPDTPGSATGNEIVEFAAQFLGTDYVWGGNDPNTGWDCSGFTSYVYSHFGYDLPRNSEAQYAALKDKEVPKDEAKPGDLVHWPGHVAIYVGGDKVYGAQNSKDATVEIDLAYAGSGTPTFHRVIDEAAVAEGDPNANANTPEGAQAYAKSLMGNYGWDDREFECLVQLWNGESNWNYQATNPTSGAYGIPQSLPASKMASHGADYRTNGQTQVRWGLDYIRDRWDYGSPCKAWELWNARSPHWY